MGVTSAAWWADYESVHSDAGGPRVQGARRGGRG
jgi:hypothetical protein